MVDVQERFDASVVERVRAWGDEERLADRHCEQTCVGGTRETRVWVIETGGDLQMQQSAILDKAVAIFDLGFATGGPVPARP